MKTYIKQKQQQNDVAIIQKFQLVKSFQTKNQVYINHNGYNIYIYSFRSNTIYYTARWLMGLFTISKCRELNNIFHIKCLKRFAFHAKLIGR